MHQHIALPEEVEPLVLERKRFDVSLHEGHPVAHALVHGSGPSLLDVELGQVQAHDSTAKAPGQRATMIASAAADIENERGSVDSACGGDLVEHSVRAWGAGSHRAARRDRPRGWPTYVYRSPPSVLSSLA